MSDIEQTIQKKINTIGKPLKEWNIQINYGIKTGCNEAFIISREIKNELVDKDAKSAEIIRPILRGRDIQRYGYDFANLWLIATFPSKNYDINEYPAIKEYLLSFGMEKLEQTGTIRYINGEKIQARKRTNNKWFETQDSISYWDDFSKPKMMWKRIGSILRFSYDDTEKLGLDSTCFATGEHIKYLVAVLNSHIGNYLMKNSPKTGTGDLIVSVQAIEPLLVPVPSIEDEQIIDNILEKIINCSGEGRDFSDYEEELEKYISRMYQFTEDELAFIKNEVECLFRGK